MDAVDLAGKPAPRDLLVNVPRLVSAYYTHVPDVEQPVQRVSFGTSGHRGSSLENSFNEQHILAVSQAIVEYRRSQGTSGPLYLGMDTHALSEPALASAIEVFVANEVELMVQSEYGYTPTPAISRAILAYNRGRSQGLSDGVVITPSHNPPGDGGFKYNPPSGGPAGTETTAVIQQRANAIIENQLKDVKRLPYERARQADNLHEFDFLGQYVEDLKNVVDLDAIAASGLKIGVDPMGGAAVHYWEPIASTYRLNLEVVNPVVDPTFSFMTVDYDGQIRMDCSSPYAMTSLIRMKDDFDIAFGNDPDVDRHGIVTPSVGLMGPNHYLAVAIWYLFRNRSGWDAQAAVGKTLVSSSIIDRVTKKLERKLVEVPVGFKWFVDGLLDGSFGFGGEESAGASFLRKDGSVWATDKDGIIMDLLAAEITAVTGRDPGEHYQSLGEEFGSPVYERIEAPANRQQKAVLKDLSPDQVETQYLADEKILSKITRAPGNDAPIGGLKVTSASGWFAARPSGTEDVYKIYAESFRGQAHLEKIQQEAQDIVKKVFSAAGV
jgi:phosphoglucomutase